MPARRRPDLAKPAGRSRRGPAAARLRPGPTAGGPAAGRGTVPPEGSRDGRGGQRMGAPGRPSSDCFSAACERCANCSGKTGRPRDDTRPDRRPGPRSPPQRGPPRLRRGTAGRPGAGPGPALMEPPRSPATNWRSSSPATTRSSASPSPCAKASKANPRPTATVSDSDDSATSSCCARLAGVEWGWSTRPSRHRCAAAWP